MVNSSRTSSTDPNRTPVAHDVFTWCNKEKSNTWHVVRNHNAKGFVERVICKACGSEHKYKPAEISLPTRGSSRNVIVRNANGEMRSPSAPVSPSRSPARSPSSSSSRSKASAAAPAIVSSASFEEMWLEGIKKWGEKAMRTFDPAEHFKVGEVVEHVVFGKGVVQTRRENRIDVLFKAGMKTLPSPQKK